MYIIITGGFKLEDYTGKIDARTNIYIPVELKAQVTEYNKANKYNKINISQVCQDALFRKLQEVTKKADVC